ncbi:MAG: PAS domain-containing sensor histidine kinase [Elusimicrobia bacterium]|nr:PAS domain-containing sensor histidine kinase [Elusimicrobiota bacterium]
MIAAGHEFIDAVRPLLDGLSDGVCIADAEGKLLYANHAAARLLGQDAASFESRTICDALCGRLASHDACCAAECPLRQPGGPQDSITFQGKYRPAERGERGGDVSDEASRDLRVRCLRVRLPHAERHFLILEDVSAEAELERRHEEWRQMLAHDLRAPLTNALGALRAIDELGTGHALTDDDVELAQIGVRACRRIEEIIDTYLAVARLEAAAMPVSLSAVDAGALARALAEEHLARAKTRRLTLRTTAPRGLLARADPELLRRALTNLLDNALKFTPEGGEVRVSAFAEGGRILLRVEDTGPGIPAADLPRVFDRFYQGERRGRGAGLGLGLTFCREAMELMGGEVAAESKPGLGSAFTLKLPRASADERPGGGR